MHLGTFQQSSEVFNQHEIDLAEALKKEGISPECFITIPEGETEIYGVKQGELSIITS
jgi:hypothetical protein